MSWHDLMTMHLPPLEKVLRTILVYIGVALLLRLGGKRDMAQLNSFDLVVMLLLANVVQNAMMGDDYSLAGGLLGAIVLLALNGVVVRLMNLHPWLTRIFEGSSTTLVRDGQPTLKALRRMGLRTPDVEAACRR